MDEQQENRMIRSLNINYFNALEIEKNLESQLEEAKNVRKDLANRLVEAAIDASTPVIQRIDILGGCEVPGDRYEVGYETIYIAIGGELKNPEKRRILFERLEELGATHSEKIVFKDNFFLTEDGRQFEAKDAGVDGKYFQKMIASLSDEARAKLIEDQLLTFRVRPKIKKIAKGKSK